MDLDLRNQIVELFEEKSEKYKLDDITYNSFNATFGFRHKFCASDIVYSTLALLEQTFQMGLSSEQGKENQYSKSLYQEVLNCYIGFPEPFTIVRYYIIFFLGSAARSSERKEEADPANCFLEALSSLSRSSESSKILERGIYLAKEQLKLVMKQVQNFINLNSIVNAGPFLYALIEDGTPDSKYFSRTNSLCLLAQFALRGHIAKSSSKSAEKLKKLPLIGKISLKSCIRVSVEL